MALVYRLDRRWPDAEAADAEARDQFRRLAAADPEQPEYQNGLANTAWMLGYLYAGGKRQPEAEAAYKEATATYRTLAEGHPAVIDFQRDLAGSLADLGDFTRDGGRSADALAVYDEADRRLAVLLGLEPRLSLAWLFLSRAQLGQAGALERLGRPAEATAAWNRAADTCKRAADMTRGPTQTWLQAHEIEARFQAGQPAQAAAVAVANARQGDNDSLYDAACALSLASGAFRRSAALPPFTAAPLAEHYAARAVAALREAVAAGFKDGKGIKEDKDLNPVRDRADFKAVIAGLEAKPKEGGR
jgi:hypothetical protein